MMQSSIYEPKDLPRHMSMTSAAIFLFAWLTGATGFLFSIAAVMLQWILPHPPVKMVLPPKNSIRSPGKLQQKSLPSPGSSENPSIQLQGNVYRHVSFSVRSNSRSSSMKQSPNSVQTIDSVLSRGSSINYDSTTVVSSPSPAACSIELPPLENLPPLPFESPQIEPQLTMSKVSFDSGSRSSFQLFKPRKWSTSSKRTDGSKSAQSSPSCSPTDQLSSSAKKGSRRSSFTSRFTIKGYHHSPGNPVPRSAISAPSTPLFEQSSLPSPHQINRQASASVSTIDISIPATTSPSRGPLSTFMNLSRPRSPSPQLLRTNPYSSPYNCPLPQPTPRGTHRKAASLTYVASINGRPDSVRANLS